MRKAQIGDLFGIETPKGIGFFQYVYLNPKDDIELIRVLPGLYAEEPQNMENLVSQKEVYFIQFPVRAAYRRKIIHLFGRYEIPSGIEVPPKQMRTTHFIRREFICWHIVDFETAQRVSVKELSDEQKKLSPWGIWNDTLLIEKMVEGWTPEKWSITDNA